ncbi:hypothetical protein V8C26DRAFT_399151 [Trichoderma gracile]
MGKSPHSCQQLIRAFLLHLSAITISATPCIHHRTYNSSERQDIRNPSLKRILSIYPLPHQFTHSCKPRQTRQEPSHHHQVDTIPSLQTKTNTPSPVLTEPLHLTVSTRKKGRAVSGVSHVLFARFFLLTHPSTSTAQPRIPRTPKPPLVTQRRSGMNPTPDCSFM